MREGAVHVGGAALGGAGDDEEVASAAAVLPFLGEELLGAVVELVGGVVEEDDGAALREGGEEGVEVVVADAGEGLDVGGLAAAARGLVGEAAGVDDALQDGLELRGAVGSLCMVSDGGLLGRVLLGGLGEALAGGAHLGVDEARGGGEEEEACGDADGEC